MGFAEHLRDGGTVDSLEGCSKNSQKVNLEKMYVVL